MTGSARPVSASASSKRPQSITFPSSPSIPKATWQPAAHFRCCVRSDFRPAEYALGGGSGHDAAGLRAGAGEPGATGCGVARRRAHRAPARQRGARAVHAGQQRRALSRRARFLAAPSPALRADADSSRSHSGDGERLPALLARCRSGSPVASTSHRDAPQYHWDAGRSLDSPRSSRTQTPPVTRVGVMRSKPSIRRRIVSRSR